MVSPSPFWLKKSFGVGIAASVLAKKPRLSNWFGRFASHVAPPGNIATAEYGLPELSTPPGQSADVKGLPSVFTFPNMLKHLKLPVYGVPSGQKGGRRGFPAKSTEAMVGLACPAAVAKLVGLLSGSALRPTHASQ